MYPVEQPKRARPGRIVLWVVAVLLVVLLLVVGGYYLWFVHIMSGAHGRLDQAAHTALATPPPEPMAASASSGGMNILLLGSDKRAGVSGGRSDTIMLVHVDRSGKFVSLLSLPRDLRVDVPGHGLNKLNTAYSYGGAALAIRTIKQVTGVNVDHYLQLDFQAFEQLADSLGGVYIDVDRRYFNDDPSYEPINIQAGYQLLDGHDALEYVRFRHDHNADFGRMLRQQRFLQALREQVGHQGAGIVFKLPSLAGALLSDSTTDLSADQVLSLAYFTARLGSGHIRQVRLVGSTPTIGGVSYVVASAGDIAQAVKDFSSPAAATSSSAAPGGSSAPATGSSTTVASGTTGHRGLSAWRAVAGTVSFTVEAPDYLPAGYAYFDRMPAAGQTYTIKTGSGVKQAVRVIFRESGHDEYLGVTETSWLGAPIASPGSTVTSGGITYTVVGSEGKPDHVWWKKGGVLFWVSNTISYRLPASELIKVAKSCGPIG